MKGKTLYKVGNTSERERLGDREIHPKSHMFIKRNKTKPTRRREGKGKYKEKPWTNTPIPETCFIHSQSKPLSLKCMSNTANQYPYL